MTTQLHPSRARSHVGAPQRKRAAFRFAGLLVAVALLLLGLVILLRLPGARVSAEKEEVNPGLEKIQAPSGDAAPPHP